MFNSRFLSLIIVTFLVACGGGDPTPAPTSTPIVTSRFFNDAKLTPNTPRAKVDVAKMDTDYHEFSTLSFTFNSRNFFKYNPDNAHAAIAMRSNIAINDIKVWGHGMVFGDVSGASNPLGSNPATQPNKLRPSVQIETWFGGIDSGNFLLATAETPPILQDNIDYQITIQSHLTSTVQTIRVVVNSNGVLIYDTGIIEDPNKYLNKNYNDIYVGYVFSNPGDWDITFKNIKLDY